MSPDGAHLALGGENGQVQMWQVSPEGTPEVREWAIGRNASPLESLAFSSGGQMLLGTDAAGATRLWAAQTGHELQFFAAQTTGKVNVAPALAFDNRLLAVPGFASEIRLFDAWTGAIRMASALPFERVQALSFAPLNEEQHTQLWKIRLH